MSTVVRRSRNLESRTLKISLSLLLLAGLGACAVEGGGYDGDVGVGVGVGYVGDYYEPCCGGYGGWGPGYRVGPPGWRGRGHDEHRGSGRPAPSIPSHPRGGGHGGGAHGGGGHH
jgi:hypothetical protein